LGDGSALMSAVVVDGRLGSFATDALGVSFARCPQCPEKPTLRRSSAKYAAMGQFQTFGSAKESRTTA
jgi:hypothetical protein